MPEFPGVDSIIGVVGSPPMLLTISEESVRIAEGLKQVWNTSHIAFLPYCMKCKEPLNWVSPKENDVIFRCPKCHREWKVE